VISSQAGMRGVAVLIPFVGSSDRKIPLRQGRGGFETRPYRSRN
jgi:hypothetical protein